MSSKEHSLFPVSHQNRLGIRDLFLTSLLFVGYFYYWYRYPFQINDPGTSPTYSSTPGFLQWGKYGLLAALEGFFLLIAFWSNGTDRLKISLDTFFYFVLFLFPAFLSIHFHDPQFAIFSFFFTIPITLQFLPGDPLNYQWISGLFSMGIKFALAVNGAQILLFACFGRLPSLGFPDSASVRFGSLWDDPNSFSLLLGFFIGFSHFYYQGPARRLVLWISFWSLFLTQSLTGIFAVSVSTISCGLFLGRNHFNSLVLNNFFPATFLFGAISGFFFILNPLWFWDIVSSKFESMYSRRFALEALEKTQWHQFLGLNPGVINTESDWIGISTNLGIFYLFILGVFILRSLLIHRNIALSTGNSRSAMGFHGGALFFLVAFVLGCFSLPYFRIFPVNLLCLLLIGCLRVP